MDKKKETRGDLERRLKNAVVLVPKDKEYQGVYFDDKGLRLEFTEDFCVISTGFHRHVFNNVTMQGVSRPYLYTKRFIEIALSNDCMVRDARGNVTNSYTRLMGVLKAKKDQTEYNVCWYYDLWLNCIFQPLYAIQETTSAMFLLYERYIHDIAHNQVLLSEKTEDMTNRQYVDKVLELMRKFTEGLNDEVIFPKLTDEERMRQEVEAIAERETEKGLEVYKDGND